MTPHTRKYCFSAKAIVILDKLQPSVTNDVHRWTFYRFATWYIGGPFTCRIIIGSTYYLTFYTFKLYHDRVFCCCSVIRRNFVYRIQDARIRRISHRCTDTLCQLHLPIWIRQDIRTLLRDPYARLRFSQSTVVPVGSIRGIVRLCNR